MQVNIEILYNEQTDRYSAFNLETNKTDSLKYQAAFTLESLFNIQIKKFSNRQELQVYVRSMRI